VEQNAPGTMNPARHTGEVTLDITVDPPHVDVLDALARRAMENRSVA
jgi:hypothetical protein